MISEQPLPRVCPVQVLPERFLSLLRWLDGRPILDVLPAFWLPLITEALCTCRDDGSPRYQRILTGMGKKNAKTLVSILVSLYKLCAWQAAGGKGNQCYYLASDLGQADDNLDLTKKLVRCNPVLERELLIKSNVIERRDGVGFIEILPAPDAAGLHGKTFLFKTHDELHTQKDYAALEALELDRTRPDAVAWFASYASLYRHAGVPLVDLLAQHAAQSDPRLFVRWYAGTVEEANPAMNTPLGPTADSIEDARRSIPSWSFRRLYLNLPGQPDGAAFDALAVEQSVVQGRVALPPVVGLTYHTFVDMSGGGADDATLAIAHFDAVRRVAVLDVLVDQGPRRKGQNFDPQQTVERFAALVAQYGCAYVTGDRYAGEWPRQAFEKVGITYRVAEYTRSELYAHLEPLLNSGQVELVDSPTLLAQLIGLVRRGERIDHPSGEHDDYANAAAGALVLVAVASAYPPLMFRCAGQTLETGEPGSTAMEHRIQPVEAEEAAAVVVRSMRPPAADMACVAEDTEFERLVREHGVWFPPR